MAQCDRCRKSPLSQLETNQYKNSYLCDDCYTRTIQEV
jgi:hypothetical protein